jgi:hypothetical protein
MPGGRHGRQTIILLTGGTEQMKRRANGFRLFLLIGIVAMIGGAGAATGHAAGNTIRYRLPQGIYIEVPKQMVKGTNGQVPEDMVVNSDATANSYLQRIATSSEALVQSNSQIIQQQKQIIQLLQALLAKPAPGQQQQQ